MENNDLPTKEEYDEYLCIVLSPNAIGMKQYERYLELAKKVKNIKFPATLEEVYKQLKPTI